MCARAHACVRVGVMSEVGATLEKVQFSSSIIIADITYSAK